VSWARECPVRKRQVESAQQAYAFRPSKFQVRATGPKPIYIQSQKPPQPQLQPQLQLQRVAPSQRLVLSGVPPGTLPLKPSRSRCLIRSLNLMLSQCPQSSPRPQFAPGRELGLLVLS
jgi:hypothetical protein